MVTTPKMDGSHMSTMLLSRMYVTSAIWTSQKKTYHPGAKLLTSTMSKILLQSGFSGDWENNKLSIDSEDVWSRYVAVSTWIFGFSLF